MASVLEDILQAVKTGITGLSLSGLSSSNVLVQKVPSIRPADLPAATSGPFVVVAPLGAEQIDPAAGTNLRDDKVYPIIAAIVAVDSQSQSANRDTYLTWRQTIIRKFNHNLTAFSGVSTVINSVVQPQAIVDPDAFFGRNVFVSAMLVQVTSREPRT